MKKTIKKLPKSKIEIEIEIPAEDWEDFFNEAVKEFSRNLQVAGFRPGKAPLNIIEREVGREKILARASELAVRKTYVKAILADKIEAIGTPKITVMKMAQGNPFIFKAEVAILPEVQLPNYARIVGNEKPKGKEDIKVEEKEIEQSLEWLQKSRAKLVTVKRGAQKGDRVEIDFSGSKDGVKVDKAESKNHPFILGQGRFVPGFEDQLFGMKEGEEKTFSITFPEDYHEKSLAGQVIDFKAKMNLVQEQILPEVNDDFAKNLGGFESLEKLKQSIKEGILLEKQELEKQNWRQRVVNLIAEEAKMELPEILVEQEIENMLDELKSATGQYGLEWGKYLEVLQKTEDDLKRDFIKQAEKRAKNALVLREIAKRENIEVTDEEVEEELNRILQKYSNIESPGSTKFELPDKVDIERLKEYTYGVLRNEKVFQLFEKQ